jgi:hypothetical protein
VELNKGNVGENCLRLAYPDIKQKVLIDNVNLQFDGFGRAPKGVQ